MWWGNVFRRWLNLQLWFLQRAVLLHILDFWFFFKPEETKRRLTFKIYHSRNRTSWKSEKASCRTDDCSGKLFWAVRRHLFQYLFVLNKRSSVVFLTFCAAELLYVCQRLWIDAIEELQIRRVLVYLCITWFKWVFFVCDCLNFIYLMEIETFRGAPCSMSLLDNSRWGEHVDMLMLLWILICCWILQSHLQARPDQ